MTKYTKPTLHALTIWCFITCYCYTRLWFQFSY